MYKPFSSIKTPSGLRNISKNSVFFIGKPERDPLEEYTIRNLVNIKKQFSENGLVFIYLPEALSKIDLHNPAVEGYISYCFPYIHDKRSLLDQASSITINNLFTNTLGINPAALPCLIFADGCLSLKAYPLDTNESFTTFLGEIKGAEEATISYRRSSRVSELDKETVNDLDILHRIDNDVLDKIKVIKEPSVIKFLIDVLSEKLSRGVEQKLSRVIVDKEYRIFLVDYNNIQINLTPLQKAVYLLFLKHKEGILFSSIADHKNELIEIYLTISNRENVAILKESIDDLIDPLSNSLNEKCSRIRSAFLMHIDEPLAREYFIDGVRGGKKFIKLPRELVEIRGNY